MFLFVHSCEGALTEQGGATRPRGRAVHGRAHGAGGDARH